ncbi:MAG TPA: sugar phosphate isomerase/epimerase [Opitutaceae bacterium]
MENNTFTRRKAVKALALSAMAIPTLAGRRAWAQNSKGGMPAGGGHRLRLGLATYSFRELSVDELIAVMKDLRLENAGPFRTHIPWAGAAEECRAIAGKFRAAGITLTGSGVFRLSNDETAVRAAFSNARAAGLDTMVCSPELAALPLVEKLVKEFDQKLAIHNHGPEDKIYPTPKDVWTAIQPFDKRIGVCVDVAHTARTGADPVEMIRLCAPRLYDLHLRDTVAPVGAMKDIPSEIGAGRLDIVGILSALIDLKYTGVVAIEYEKGGNVLAGASESIGYTRGVLAALERG